MNLSERRPLAKSPLALPVLGLGCSQLGGLYRDMPLQQAVDTLASAWQQGIRYFDTAPFYGYGRSEHRLGAFLDDQPRDEVVLSSKVGRLLAPNGSERGNDDGWARPLPFKPVYDYSYDAILRSHEDSLQRLGLARIDILYVHDIGHRTHGERHDRHWQALTAAAVSARWRSCAAEARSRPSAWASTNGRSWSTASTSARWTAPCWPVATPCWSRRA